MDMLRRFGAWLVEPDTLWVALWVGLGVFTVVLMTLLHTRLGKTKPVQKCAILAVWFHLLLLIYATSVTIVAERVGGGGQVTINLGMGEPTADRPVAALKSPTPAKPAPMKDLLPKSAAPRARTASLSAPPAKSDALPKIDTGSKLPIATDSPRNVAPRPEISKAPPPLKSSPAPRPDTSVLTRIKTPAPVKLSDLPDPLAALSTPSPAKLPTAEPAKLGDVAGPMTPIPRDLAAADQSSGCRSEAFADRAGSAHASASARSSPAAADLSATCRRRSLADRRGPRRFGAYRSRRQRRLAMAGHASRGRRTLVAAAIRRGPGIRSARP
ncbi:MAG: hypothetical protein QM775_27650 [Pirellulales bacterium]